MDPTEKQIIFAVYLGTGIVMGGLGVPLWLEMVPPNRWYGFKTPSAVANEKIWYPVNRVTGFWLVIMGFACVGAATCGYLADLPVDTASWVNLGVCATCIVFMTIHSVGLLLRLKMKFDA